MDWLGNIFDLIVDSLPQVVTLILGSQLMVFFGNIINGRYAVRTEKIRAESQEQMKRDELESQKRWNRAEMDDRRNARVYRDRTNLLTAIIIATKDLLGMRKKLTEDTEKTRLEDEASSTEMTPDAIEKIRSDANCLLLLASPEVCDISERLLVDAEVYMEYYNEHRRDVLGYNRISKVYMSMSESESMGSPEEVEFLRKRDAMHASIASLNEREEKLKYTLNDFIEAARRLITSPPAL